MTNDQLHFQNSEELTLLKRKDFESMRNGIIFTQEEEVRFNDMCNEIIQLQSGEAECKLLAMEMKK